MFIIANSLPFNGGSTFVVRLAREFAKQGERIGVLFLANNTVKNLLDQLTEVADVYFLKDFIRSPFKWTGRSLLGMFAPIVSQKLRDVILNYGKHIHVMGVFGLVFAAKLNGIYKHSFSVSVGVYHQYEYMFKSTSFLGKYSQNLFKSLDQKGIIFFNEASQSSYSRFFDVDYVGAKLLPIGIELPDVNDIGDPSSYRIISIGNLYPFKTYNLHIVKLMPELLKLNKNFTYEIYGVGELEKDVVALIKKLGLEEKVFLKGTVPYGRISEVLNGAFLFVGSGTAILESSALGIPSIIGIEASSEPLTFGFLSDIKGYSYNELNSSKKTVPIYDLIKSISSNGKAWGKRSMDCFEKAKQFSIYHTINGFRQAEIDNPHLGKELVASYNGFRLFLDFLLIGIKELLHFKNSFSRRRNL